MVKKNGRLKQGRLQDQVKQISSRKATYAARTDAAGIGNVYAENKGKNSHSVNSDNGSYVGGQTENSFYADMNTHDVQGDMGEI